MSEFELTIDDVIETKISDDNSILKEQESSSDNSEDTKPIQEEQKINKEVINLIVDDEKEIFEQFFVDRKEPPKQTIPDNESQQTVILDHKLDSKKRAILEQAKFLREIQNKLLEKREYELVQHKLDKRRRDSAQLDFFRKREIRKSTNLILKNPIIKFYQSTNQVCEEHQDIFDYCNGAIVISKCSKCSRNKQWTLAEWSEETTKKNNVSNVEPDSNLFFF